MKNKKGMTALAIIMIVLGVAIVGIIGYGVLSPSEPQVIVQEPSILAGTGCADSTGILTVNDVSKIPGGTAPTSPTLTAGIDGGKVATTVTSGTTTFPVGAEITLLVSDTDSIDESFNFVMPCGGKTLDGALYYSTSDNPGIRMKNDDDDFMTDTGATGTNQTDLTAGETFVIEVEFQGTNTEASGEGIYVIELPASSGANVTSIVIAGLESVPIPSVHTLQNAGSEAAAFKVPTVVGAEKATYTISVALTATKDLSGMVLTNWYAMQSFIDDDQTIAYGVEDSDGTAKYENTIGFSFLIEAS